MPKQLDDLLLSNAPAANITIIKSILKKGANINAKNEIGDTPLHLAIIHANEEVVKFLLNNGADFELANNKGLRSLHMAAYFGRENIVKLLLDKKAQINVLDQDNTTPLHYAAYFGHKNVIELLLKSGAYSQPKNKYGTPGKYAMLNGSKGMDEFILKYCQEHTGNIDLSKNNSTETFESGVSHTSIMNQISNQQNIHQNISNLQQPQMKKENEIALNSAQHSGYSQLPEKGYSGPIAYPPAYILTNQYDILPEKGDTYISDYLRTKHENYDKLPLNSQQNISKDNYERAIKLHDLGISTADAGDREEAIGYFDEAIKLSPREPKFYCNRGIAKRNLVKLEEAIKDFSHAILLDDKDSNAYHNRGFTKFEWKQFKESIDDFNEVIALNSNPIMIRYAYYNRGRAEFALNLMDNAEEDFSKVQSLSTSEDNIHIMCKKYLSKINSLKTDKEDSHKSSPFFKSKKEKVKRDEVSTKSSVSTIISRSSK